MERPIGRVLRALGLRGEILVQLFRPRRNPRSTRAKGDLLTLDTRHDGVCRYAIQRVRWMSSTKLALCLEGVSDRTRAERLAESIILLDSRHPTEALSDEPDRLIGARTVEHSTNGAIGTVIAVQDNGAQALLVIDPEGGGEAILVPYVPEFIAAIDELDDIVIVRIASIPGLLGGEGAA